MRVPVYPEDLLPQAAFKKLAKSIQNRWPGTSTIQLSLARETLSRGLGYADYYGLREASVHCPIDAETPAVSVVRAQIATSIASVLALANDNSLPHSALEAYVETLPLKALSTFKVAASRGVHFKVPSTLGPDLNHSAPLNTTAPESGVLSTPRPPVRHKKSRLHTSRLTPDDLILTAIKQNVENSGSLRDQSLFALLETGLRGHDILGTKVSQVVSLDTYMPSSAEKTIQITKPKSPLPIGKAAVIERYISAENLSTDDYLFPSKDRTQPMSTAQLSQIFQSWIRQVKPPRPKLTPGTLRLAAALRLAASTPTSHPEIERLADQLGHSSIYMVEQYVSSRASVIDEISKPKE